MVEWVFCMNLVFFDSSKELETTRAFFSQDELVVAKGIGSEKDWAQFKLFAEKNSEQKFLAVLSKPDSKLLHQAKQAGFLVGVLGNSLQSSMSACQQKADFLLQPFGFEKPFFDWSVLGVASQNNVSIGLFFSDCLIANPVSRAKWLRNAFLLARLTKKARVTLVVFSAARSFWEYRSEKDLETVAGFLNRSV
jgi:hypothetical protein